MLVYIAIVVSIAIGATVARRSVALMSAAALWAVSVGATAMLWDEARDGALDAAFFAFQVVLLAVALGAATAAGAVRQRVRSQTA
ncbi:MAG TPA: hypothetical protein VM093_05915 [Aeromicrobium sp.]|nr:hypothetical protein [Aeromicrobium sp.]